MRRALLCLACLLAAPQGCGSKTSSPSRSAGGSDASTGDSGGDSASSSGGPSTQTYPPLMFSDIGPATLVSGQFYFTEGPVWDPAKNVLYFTDINAQQNGHTGGAIYQLTLPNTIDVFFQPDGSADGIGLDPQGNLIAAGFASRNVWRLSNGSMETLSPCSAPPAATCY